MVICQPCQPQLGWQTHRFTCTDKHSSLLRTLLHLLHNSLPLHVNAQRPKRPKLKGQSFYKVHDRTLETTNTHTNEKIEQWQWTSADRQNILLRCLLTLPRWKRSSEASRNGVFLPSPAGNVTIMRLLTRLLYRHPTYHFLPTFLPFDSTQVSRCSGHDSAIHWECWNWNAYRSKDRCSGAATRHHLGNWREKYWRERTNGCSILWEEAKKGLVYERRMLILDSNSDHPGRIPSIQNIALLTWTI